MCKPLIQFFQVYSGYSFNMRAARYLLSLGFLANFISAKESHCKCVSILYERLSTIQENYSDDG